MPLMETMVINHRDNACKTCVSVHIRARDSRPICAVFRLVVDRVVARMNSERESG